MRKLVLLLSFIFLGGCISKPDLVEPVGNFELSRYLGKWYEIARLDHSFERGLSKVSAEYTLNKNGSIRVINRGFSKEDNAWNQAEGKAYFVNSSDEGFLKVSFFGPFYGSYIIFHLDQDDYQYAFVSGPNTDYLWLLARTPSVAPPIIEKFLSLAEQRGFNIDEIIYVDQD